MPVHFSAEEMSARRARAAGTINSAGLDGTDVQAGEHVLPDGIRLVWFQHVPVSHMDTDGHTTLLTRLPDLRQAQYTSDIKDIRLWHDVEGVNPGEELRAMLQSLGCKGNGLVSS